MQELENRNDESVDIKYANLIKKILDEGEVITTRNSEVKRLTEQTLEFTTTPLIGIRKTAWRQCILEFEWFLSGSDNINDLDSSVRHWWSPWATPTGMVKFNYGQQLRRFKGVDPDTNEVVEYDQIANFINGIRDHPYSRRNIITTWNPYEMNHPQCRLTNCHTSLTMGFVTKSGLLDMHTTQRSTDVICGLPHNLFQAAAFHLWIAAKCHRRVGRMVWRGLDNHCYAAHYELAREIVNRVTEAAATPVLLYTSTSEEFKAADFSLQGSYLPVIKKKAEMIV